MYLLMRHFLEMRGDSLMKRCVMETRPDAQNTWRDKSEPHRARTERDIHADA